MINLFVDDVREPTDIYHLAGKDWIIARTSSAALEILYSCVEIKNLSLDHDLGGEDTIEPILTYLQKMAFEGHINLPRYIRGHSANPVGMQKINQVIEWINERR